MARRFQFNLATLLGFVAFAAFAVQIALLAWYVYREIVVQLAQAALVFFLFGLLWFAHSFRPSSGAGVVAKPRFERQCHG